MTTCISLFFNGYFP